MPLRPSLSRAPRTSPEKFWGRTLLNDTPALRPLLEPLTRASCHDLTVLLTGATGTGKTYHARLIHEQSPRRDHPLVIVPCGGLAPRLLAGELFGRVRGAIPEADQDEPGKLALAGHGTVHNFSGGTI